MLAAALSIPGAASFTADPDYVVQPVAIFSYSDDDSGPNSLVRGADGVVYASSRGGRGTSISTNGLVLKFTPAGVPIELASFPVNGRNGSYPRVQLIDAHGRDLSYKFQQSLRFRALLRLAPSGELQPFGRPNGFNVTGMVEANGRFLGITAHGGASDQGTIFSMSRNGEHQLLYSFSSPDGTNPRNIVALPDGTLFGTTSDWATSQPDVVFRFSPGGQFSIVASAMTGMVRRPFSLVVASDQLVYGVDQTGGPDYLGSIFRSLLMVCFPLFMNSRDAMVNTRSISLKLPMAA